MVARTMPRLTVTPPSEATVGKPDRFDVMLISPTGAPMIADRDIAFTISGAGFEAAERAVLKRGATSLEVPFIATAPGLADVTLNPAESNVLPFAAHFAAVLPDTSYKAELPLSIRLRLTPPPPLLYGQGEPRIVAYLFDKTGASVSAATELEVAFPEFRQLVEPHPLIIEKGAKYGEARIRAAGAGAFRSPAIVTPAAMDGSRVSIDPDPMEFSVLGEVARWRPLTERPVVSGVLIPPIPVSLTLIGQTGQPVDADMDRTAILSVDPPDAGFVKPSTVTVSKGTRATTVTYTPLREGKGTIQVEQTGLPGQPLEITFAYTLLAFGRYRPASAREPEEACRFRPGRGDWPVYRRAGVSRRAARGVRRLHAAEPAERQQVSGGAHLGRDWRPCRAGNFRLGAEEVPEGSRVLRPR
jgi:hypothetical protein